MAISIISMMRPTWRVACCELETKTVNTVCQYFYKSDVQWEGQGCTSSLPVSCVYDMSQVLVAY